MRTNLTITRDDIEVEVEVEFTFIPFYRGRRDSIGRGRNNGPPLEPDEPESFEIESVKDSEGNDYDLTESEIEEVAEEYYDMREAALEDQFDSRFDR